ncbi:MAG: HAMP domain-containing sensor histidine kinase [Hyphomicrobium sp.]
MARTWSVPQRGNIADFHGFRFQQNVALADVLHGRGLGHRGVFLALAAVLTAAGAIVPHLSSESLSTMLFLAGAGLAALVVVMPWQQVFRTEYQPPHTNPEIGPSHARGPEEPRQTRFPELLTAGAGRPNLDRAAWAKLTAHMSHELRTPLNAVLGFSEMMTNEVFGPLGDGYSSYARDIHASGRILLKSAEDALAITSLLTDTDRRRAREICRLKSVIDDACAFVAPDLAARSIAVTIDVTGNPEIVGHHPAMRQMLINLIIEAARDASAGSVLRIGTKSASETISLSLELLSSGDGRQTQEGFGIILARTFCELSGAELIGGSTGAGDWEWTVRLPRAAQADLFAAA